MAKIKVTDSGDGMSEEELENLFQDDKRFSLSSTGMEQGKALGLFISKKMALQHGGDLTAFSDGLGFGSTYSLLLPLYCIPDDQETVEDSRLEESRQHAHIPVPPELSPS